MAATTTRVSSITVYPVKSCGGVSVEAATLTETGLRFDRCWMVVNVKPPPPNRKQQRKKKSPPKNMFVSQRSDPKMALVSSRASSFPTQKLPRRLSVNAPSFKSFVIVRARSSHDPLSSSPIFSYIFFFKLAVLLALMESSVRNNKERNEECARPTYSYRSFQERALPYP